MATFHVTMTVHEVKGLNYTERKFNLELHTTRDLADLQDILISAANEANTTKEEDFEVLEAQERVSRDVFEEAFR